jgi:hypothetical protein
MCGLRTDEISKSNTALEKSSLDPNSITDPANSSGGYISVFKII